MYRQSNSRASKEVWGISPWKEQVTSRTTSRDRPTSAPYLRLKNSKRTLKRQGILFYSIRETQKLSRIGASGGRFETFHPLCRKSSKNWRGTRWWKNLLEKSLIMSKKKLKGGILWDFSTSILSQIFKQIERGPFGDFFSKKSRNAEKN